MAVSYLQWSDAQNIQLYQALQDMESERVTLSSKIDALQEDSRLTAEHVSAMEGKKCVDGKTKQPM